MKIKITRLNDSIPLPSYQTTESAGFDIASTVDMIIPPHGVEKVPTGLIIAAPGGHFLLIAARSSLPLKKGLIIANGVGVIDPDYAGPTDQIYILLHNFTHQPVEIKKGERLAQGIFLPFVQAIWEEVESIRDDDRGGMGSTGGYI
ncbi:Deoxyuridine 5'-triphosphate nucleotidohydrolase [Gammaproteobacteria bacterium]